LEIRLGDVFYTALIVKDYSLLWKQYFAKNHYSNVSVCFCICILDDLYVNSLR